MSTGEEEHLPIRLIGEANYFVDLSVAKIVPSKDQCRARCSFERIRYSARGRFDIISIIQADDPKQDRLSNRKEDSNGEKSVRAH